MTEYVVGLAFSEQRDRVVLIKKKRGPAQLIGKWNGVGGHMEESDGGGSQGAANAMVREFFEETGVETKPEQWTEFMQLEGADWVVAFFYCVSNEVASAVRTTEDEIVGAWWINYLPSMELAPNLSWIIPMALNHRRDNVEVYRVSEEVLTKGGA